VKRLIKVFEYDKFYPEEHSLPDSFNDALENFRASKSDFPYYELIKNGIRFCNYVGVIQIGNVTIEVLPKIDKEIEDKDIWQKILIDMLKQSGAIQTDTPSSSNLQLKSNSILDIYIELFIFQCESLLHNGLIKRYRKTEGNKNALKGTLNFGKHIQQNLVHKERFFVNYNTYDDNHLLNQILLKTLKLLYTISHSAQLSSRIGSLLLNFPELPDVKVTDATFEKIEFDRKSASYKSAIDLALLLLLNYHPDVTQGRKNVLALMFDMNVLWEKWVLCRLKKFAPDGINITGQAHEIFWSPSTGNGGSKTLRPDIRIEMGEEVIILDTKWKLPKDGRPSDDDLKQMFAYNLRFGAKRSILVYPGRKPSYAGQFFDAAHGSCELYFLDVVKDGKLVGDGVWDLLKAIEKI